MGYRTTSDHIVEVYEGPTGKVILSYKDTTAKSDEHHPRMYTLSIEVKGTIFVIDGANADELPYMRRKMNALKELARAAAALVKVPRPDMTNPESLVGDLCYYATTVVTKNSAKNYKEALIQRNMSLYKQRRQEAYKIVTAYLECHFRGLEPDEYQRLCELYF